LHQFPTARRPALRVPPGPRDGAIGSAIAALILTRKARKGESTKPWGGQERSCPGARPGPLSCFRPFALSSSRGCAFAGGRRGSGDGPSHLPTARGRTVG